MLVIAKVASPSNSQADCSRQTFTTTNYVDYTYDDIGQLKTAKGWEPGGSTARLQEQFGYGYDRAWNLNSRTNNALEQKFNVDSLNQLTSVTRSGTFTMAGGTSQTKGGYAGWGDPAGVTNVTVSGIGLSPVSADLYLDGSWARAGVNLVNGNNDYTATAKDTDEREDSTSVLVNLPATNSFVYDLNGNLRTNNSRIFEYDDENQLVRITEPNVWKSEFSYDGMLRRRARKEYTWQGSAWVLTNEVRYVYDGRLVIQERDGYNIPQVSYTRGNDLSGSLEGAGGIGGLIARTDNSQLLAEDPEGAHAYYQYDGNGNVTSLIDTNGMIVARYHYDPYGNMLAMSGPLADANLYRFSCKEWHQNSRFVYYLYRFYSPNLQRWLNRDPIGEEGGLNLYTFIFNKSGNSIDLFGLADPNPDLTPPPAHMEGGPYNQWCLDQGNDRGGVWKNAKGETVSWDPQHGHWDRDLGDGTRVRYNNKGARLKPGQHTSPRPTRPIPYRNRVKVRGIAPWIGFLPDILDAIRTAIDASRNRKSFRQEAEDEFKNQLSDPSAAPYYRDWDGTIIKNPYFRGCSAGILLRNEKSKLPKSFSDRLAFLRIKFISPLENTKPTASDSQIE